MVPANIRGGKVIAANNIFTVLAGAALLVVLATVAFVAYKCYVQYDTIFTVR